MKRAGTILVLAVWLFGCEERSVTPMGEYEARKLEHQLWEFQIYPGARYLEELTEAYKRAHFLMNPEDDEAPRMAVYESEDSIDQVGAFYADKYGYGRVEPNAVNDFKPFAPPAYFSEGSLEESTRQILPMLEALELSTSIEGVEGEFRSAHIEGIDRYPRVTLQSPWYDVIDAEVRETTMILMVLELPE